MKVCSVEPSHLWGETTLAPTPCTARFGLMLECSAAEAWWQPQSRVIGGSVELGFCAHVEERWSEDAPQRGHASSLGKQVFASKVSSARTPRALVLPRFLLLCLHDFLT